MKPLLAVLLTTLLASTCAFYPPTALPKTKPARNAPWTTSFPIQLQSTSSDSEDISPFVQNAKTIASSVTTLSNKTIVVKYGGNAMTSPLLKKLFCEDVALLRTLGVKAVVVHGGGPQISSMLEKTQIKTTWEKGLRVSSPEVVQVAEMVLCGSVNKEIANAICNAGGRAIGLSGRDDRLLRCTKQLTEDGTDLGLVGRVESVNTAFLNQLLDMGITPVISPIGCGIGEEEAVAYNVNADVAAGRIAGELKAERVLFLTDIQGVLDSNGNLIASLTTKDVEALIQDETITGGMIPKVSYATDAVKLGVKGAFITDGRVPHALMNEVLAGGGAGLGSGQGGTVITYE